MATPQLILILPMTAIMVARFREQVDLDHPRLWIGAALFAFTAVAGLILLRPGRTTERARSR